MNVGMLPCRFNRVCILTAALDWDQLRELGHRNQGRICSQPSHEVEVRVLPGRIAAGPRCRDYSVRMEAALPRDDWRLGLSKPADRQTLRFWFAAKEGTQNCGTSSQDFGSDRLAHPTSQLPRMAGRDWCSSRGAAETHAPRQHFDHDERLRRSLHESEAQSQHLRRAARVASRSHQIERDRLVDGLCSCLSNLTGPFRTTIKNPNSS